MVEPPPPPPPPPPPSPLSPFALTSLEDAKEYIGIPPGDTSQDAFLTRLINQATARIESWLRRLIVQRQYMEHHDSTGSAEVTTKQFPIVALAEVNVDPSRKFLPATALALENVAVDSEAGRVVIGIWRGLGIPRGVQIIRVKYKGGFEPVPEDIRLACNKAVAQEFRRARQGMDGIASESILGYAVSYKDGLSDDIKELLVPFRRLAT